MIKLYTLMSARQLIVSHANDKVPAALAYKFMKFIKASDQEETFYVEKMQKIIDEFGERDDAGNIKTEDGRVIISRERVNECNSAIAELRSTEVDKPEIAFSPRELASLTVTTSEMLALSDFMVEE